MSRSSYSDDSENVGLWRANVDRAIAGKRGQKFLREMAAALDAMPVKELVANETVRDSEHVCAMGSVYVARGLEIGTAELDNMDAADVGEKLGISRVMAQEIAFENDDDLDHHRDKSDADRWTRMRAWVAANLRSDGTA